MKLLSCSAVLCTVFGLTAFAPEANSQDRRDRNSGGEVCVYEHEDYGGWEQCYRVGDNVPDLGDRRNKISSVRIRGRAEIALYEHPNFEGQKVYVDSSVPDIRKWARNWNDQVDSLRVEPAGFGGRRPDRGQAREDRVCVYQHVNYQGNSQCWNAGEDIDDLKRVGWNDGISSIRTFGRTRFAVFEHAGFQGERLIIDHDVPDLTRVDANSRANWNDRISSVRISGGSR